MNETTKKLAEALELLISYIEIDYPDNEGNVPVVYINAKQALAEYRAEQEKPNNEIKLLNTTDAMVWATEFNKIYPMILKDGEGVTDSKEVLLTWFANAIMAGYDHARRKYEPKNELVELDRKKLHDLLIKINLGEFNHICNPKSDDFAKGMKEGARILNSLYKELIVPKIATQILKTFGEEKVNNE